MDSIDFEWLANAAMLFVASYVFVGAVFTRIPFTSHAYVLAAYGHAKAAMGTYEQSRKDSVSIANGVVPLRAQIARNAILIANAAFEFHENRRKYLIHFAWMSELLWTFGFRMGTIGLEFERKRMLVRAGK